MFGKKDKAQKPKKEKKAGKPKKEKKEKIPAKLDMSKPYNPSADDLSEAISFAMKDYSGPVTTSIVNRKVQIEHPNWKLNSKRLNKGIQSFMEGQKNATPAADKDASASMKKQSSKGRLFSSFSKRGSTTSNKSEPEPVEMEDSEEEEVEETTEPTPSPQPSPVAAPPSPVAEAASPQDPPPLLEKTTSETPVTEDEEEEVEQEERAAAVVKTVPSKTKSNEIAYHTDDAVADTPAPGFWGLPGNCAVMLCAQ